jgi:hypothetical protein
MSIILFLLVVPCAGCGGVFYTQEWSNGHLQQVVHVPAGQVFVPEQGKSYSVSVWAAYECNQPGVTYIDSDKPYQLVAGQRCAYLPCCAMHYLVMQPSQQQPYAQQYAQNQQYVQQPQAVYRQAYQQPQSGDARAFGDAMNAISDSHSDMTDSIIHSDRQTLRSFDRSADRMERTNNQTLQMLDAANRLQQQQLQQQRDDFNRLKRETDKQWPGRR